MPASWQVKLNSHTVFIFTVIADCLFYFLAIKVKTVATENLCDCFVLLTAYFTN
jgi:hypothetical protein